MLFIFIVQLCVFSVVVFFLVKSLITIFNPKGLWEIEKSIDQKIHSNKMYFNIFSSFHDRHLRLVHEKKYKEWLVFRRFEAILVFVLVVCAAYFFVEDLLFDLGTIN